jgi:thioredoxin-dependent peroxiredoxin
MLHSTSRQERAMNPRVACLVISLGVAALLATGSLQASPPVGAPAPAFELPDQEGETRRLEDYAGKWLVLYFYPKDNTPGCTTQACEFRDNIFAFRRLDAEIVGISLDDVDTHRSFAEEHSLPFTLLADDGGVARDYGVLRNFGVVQLASRQTFLISPEGVIARHYEKVDVNTHSAEVLRDIESLREGG